MITLPGVDPNMIANNLTPSYLIHPGEMIKDEIQSRGITQKQLAEMTGVPKSVVNDILNGKSPVSTEFARLLEAALNIDADIWIKLQADYDKRKASESQPVSTKNTDKSL